MSEKVNDRNTIENEIRKLVFETLKWPETVQVADCDNLRELGMDSLNCIELIVKIENNFDIEISDEQLGIEYVSTIGDVCQLVESYLKDYKEGAQQK